MLEMANQEKATSEDPIHLNKDYAKKSIDTFNEFIQKLHAATLKLQRVD